MTKEEIYFKIFNPSVKKYLQSALKYNFWQLVIDSAWKIDKRRLSIEECKTIRKVAEAALEKLQRDEDGLYQTNEVRERALSKALKLFNKEV